MFRFTQKTNAFPKEKILKEISLEAVVSNNEPDFEQAKEEGFLDEDFNRLRKAWRGFKGPVRNVNHFGVAIELDEEEQLYGFAEYKECKVRCRLMGRDELPMQLLQFVEFRGQRVSERKIRPNEKCPCASGKKWKRCCGR